MKLIALSAARCALLIAPAVLLAFLPSRVAADDSLLFDTVQLANGGVILGKATTINDGGQQFWLVETRDGGTLKLRRSQVRHVRKPPEAAPEYLERLKSMPDSIAAHWEMQQWCSENRLARQREFHLMQVIRHDPDHRDARRLMNYRMVDGVWVHTDHFHQNQGYVREGTQWRLPKSIELNAQKEEVRDRIKARDVEIRSLVRKYQRGDQTALAEIIALNDPAAVSGLKATFIAQLDLGLRRAILDALGAIQSPGAQNALVEIAMAELPEAQSSQIREHCVRLLKQAHFNQQDVTTALRPFLSPKPEYPNWQVNAAAWIIGQMDVNGQLKSTTLVGDLINALVTTHKVQIAASGGNLTINQSDRGSGLETGNKPTHQNLEFPNEAVLDALRALTQSRDFGYDERAWLNWYIGTRSIGDMTINRDE